MTQPRFVRTRTDCRPHARRDLFVAVVESEPPLEERLHHADDVVHFHGVRERRMAHEPPGDEIHLPVLDVECRGGKVEERADVIVVHVRDDDVAHFLRFHAEERQSGLRRAQVLALALRRDFRGEAGVDHDGPIRITDEPYEVVHRHRCIVRVAAEEVVGAARVAPRIADRVNLVFGDGHDASSMMSMKLSTRRAMIRQTTPASSWAYARIHFRLR
jgi:hypothetical protein